MAAGAPVVASDLAPFARVLAGGDAGELFATGDAAALAGAVSRVLDDDALRTRLRRIGRSTAARYDWSVVTRDVLAVYETVLAGTRVVPAARWRPGPYRSGRGAGVAGATGAVDGAVDGRHADRSIVSSWRSGLFGGGS